MTLWPVEMRRNGGRPRRQGEKVASTEIIARFRIDVEENRKALDRWYEDVLALYHKRRVGSGVWCGRKGIDRPTDYRLQQCRKVSSIPLMRFSMAFGALILVTFFSHPSQN
jgi:hypothetical protein